MKTALEKAVFQALQIYKILFIYTMKTQKKSQDTTTKYANKKRLTHIRMNENTKEFPHT